MHEKVGSDSTVLYMAYKAVGDTTAFAFAKWPKSLVPRQHTIRPSLDYFADAGSIAYYKAGRSAEKTNLSTDVSDLMMKLSNGFKKYAGALHMAFQEMGDIPETDISMLLELSKIFGSDGVIRRYDLRNYIDLEQEKEKKLIFN